MRDVVKIFVSFFSFSILDTLSLVHWSCDHLVIAFIVLIFDSIHSPIFTCVVSFLFFIHMFLI